MFFKIELSNKELQSLKEEKTLLYKLFSKFAHWRNKSFEDLLSLGKKNGLVRITDKKVYKKLNINEDTIYKFRLSDKYRCYCIQSINTKISALEIIFIDTKHTMQK